MVEYFDTVLYWLLVVYAVGWVLLVTTITIGVIIIAISRMAGNQVAKITFERGFFPQINIFVITTVLIIIAITLRS